MKSGIVALVSGGLLALGLAGAASAAPAAKPSPTPTVAPYTLGQQIITDTKTPVFVDGVTVGTEIVLTCPAGKVVTGGGFQSYWPISEKPNAGQYQTHDANSPIRQSFPSGPSEWTVRFEKDHEVDLEPVTAYAVCVNA